MNDRDKIRLVKLEEEIQATREQLDMELRLEEASGRRTLLMSRVFAKKLEKLLHRKVSLEKITKSYRDKRSSYDLVLEKRRKEMDIAENAVRDVEILLAQTIALHMVQPSATFDDDILTYKKLLRSKRVLLANKNRALNNWLDRTVDVSEISRIASQRINAPLNINKTQSQAIVNPMSLLPDWMKKPENNASLDLLTRPPDIGMIDGPINSQTYTGAGQSTELDEEFVEENPFLLQEKKKEIII